MYREEGHARKAQKSQWSSRKICLQNHFLLIGCSNKLLRANYNKRNWALWQVAGNRQTKPGDLYFKSLLQANFPLHLHGQDVALFQQY